MALQTNTLARAFRYNSVALPDPGPQYTLEQVRDLFAATYPEIVNAAIEGPEEKSGELVYTFRRAVGTKGGSTKEFPDKARRGMAWLGTARRGTARRGRARQGLARRGRARHGTARPGEAWQGRAWQGLGFSTDKRAP
jgi:PRTRC genetic system protein C